MSTALILIADGTEEMEFTISYDTLTRAGIKCTSALVSDAPSTQRLATCSRGVKIVPDAVFSDLKNAAQFDALIIPGGAKGADTISKNSSVQSVVREFYEKKKYIGMICAGSLTALTSKLPRQPLTSHPSVRDQLDTDFDYKEDSVVVSGNLVTSRGPGTTFPFALKLVALMVGEETMNQVRAPMVFPDN